MTREEILNLIDDKHYFHVRFLKANGEVRDMVASFGVKKFVTGQGKKFEDVDRNLITVWEPKTKAYKSFKADRVISIKANGKIYENH